MDVMSKSYLFDSPYHSRVQFGREDTTAQQNQNTQQQSQNLAQNSNETLKQAQTFQSTQQSDVEPTVKSSSTNLLDTYA